MNIKTIDPYVVDVLIDNCIDLQGKLTTFTSILEDFPDENVISNIYAHARHKCDSIYDEIKFYSDIHEKSLKISTNKEGGLSSLLTTTPTIGRLYSELGDDEFLSLDIDGNPQFRADGAEVLIETGKDTSDGSIKSSQTWKPITKFAEADYSLVNTIGLDSLPTWFLMYWLDRFRTSHQQVRDSVNSAFPESIYYRPFSESVGSLKNVEFIKTTTSSPMVDVDSAEDIPYPYTGVLNYIMTDNDKRVSLTLSRNTHRLFRTNIIPVLDDPYTSSTGTPDSIDSHGINLVTDNKHYPRMKDMVGDIHTTIQNELKDMYRVLMFISNNSSTLKVPNVMYKKYTEGLFVDVDLLKNRTQKLATHIKTRDILQAT